MLYRSDLTEDERGALDAQLRNLFAGGVYGLWFDAVVETPAAGFDEDFVRHVESVRAAAQ
jgi:hypothetical protein